MDTKITSLSSITLKPIGPPCILNVSFYARINHFEDVASLSYADLPIMTYFFSKILKVKSFIFVTPNLIRKVSMLGSHQAHDDSCLFPKFLMFYLKAQILSLAISSVVVFERVDLLNSY